MINAAATVMYALTIFAHPYPSTAPEIQIYEYLAFFDNKQVCETKKDELIQRLNKQGYFIEFQENKVSFVCRKVETDDISGRYTVPIPVLWKKIQDLKCTEDWAELTVLQQKFCYPTKRKYLISIGNKEELSLSEKKLEKLERLLNQW